MTFNPSYILFFKIRQLTGPNCQFYFGDIQVASLYPSSGEFVFTHTAHARGWGLASAMRPSSIYDNSPCPQKTKMPIKGKALGREDLPSCRMVYFGWVTSAISKYLRPNGKTKRNYDFIYKCSFVYYVSFHPPAQSRQRLSTSER